jgi:hypothetical protein
MSTSKTTKKKTSPARPPAPNLAEAAFDATQLEMETLRSDDLLPINLDIPASVSVALGVEPHLQLLVPEIERVLPAHPIGCIKDLRRYALAAWYAHLLSVPVARDEGAVKPLLAEAAPLREALLVAAEALAHRKLLDPARVAEIRAGHGNVDTANDLVALSALLSSEWGAVSSKTAIEEHEVQRAGVLGTELLAALGVRDVRGATKTDAQDARARAYTIFVRAYDDCRRALIYLRWNEGDADAIAPSLFARRTRGRPAGPTPPAAGADPVTGDAGAVAPTS